MPYTFKSDYAAIFQGIDFSSQFKTTEDEMLVSRIRENPFFKNGTIQEVTQEADKPTDKPSDRESILAEITRLEAEQPKMWQASVARLKKKLDNMEE